MKKQLIMRQKTPHTIVTFSCTSDALAAEAKSNAHLLPGRIIPVPSEIAAGCGLAWCVPESARNELLRALEREELSFEGIFSVDLY